MESTCRYSLRIPGFGNENLRGKTLDPASRRLGAKDPIADERDDYDSCSDVKRGLTSRAPVAENAEHRSHVSTTNARDGEVPSDCDRHGLRPARGIALAIILSLGFWALVAIGLF